MKIIRSYHNDPLSLPTLEHSKFHGFLLQVTHDGWLTSQKNWYGLCYDGDTLVKVRMLHNPNLGLFYVGDTLVKVVMLHNPNLGLFYVSNTLVTVVSSHKNLYEIANKSLNIQVGPNTCTYFVGLLQQWLDKFEWSKSLCGTIPEVCEVGVFHSYAMATLATFLYVVTNVVIKSGIYKFCPGALAYNLVGYNIIGIGLNVANGYEIALHGVASLFEFDHGLIKHYGLNGSVPTPNMLLIANIVLYGYVQEVMVRLNSTLDMLFQYDVVMYEFIELMCNLQINNQEADCPLHFIFEQWNSGGHLHLDMSTMMFSQFKEWDPEKFMVEALFYNLEDKVDLEGVGNDRIFRIRNINVVTQLVLKCSMAHLNLKGIFKAYSIS